VIHRGALRGQGWKSASARAILNLTER
jgi:hypothetical protein